MHRCAESKVLDCHIRMAAAPAVSLVKAPGLILLALTTLALLVVALRAIVHPLRRIPGPFFARLTRLWYLTKIWKGDFQETNIALHEKYGMQRLPLTRSNKELKFFFWQVLLSVSLQTNTVSIARRPFGQFMDMAPTLLRWTPFSVVLSYSHSTFPGSMVPR